ncbi:MAG: ABC transporter ATP-binding protein [Gammaproteobacteria bacterium]|nr:ABC transporter ATP-binding protein [Gammaproteobacteria bacterium]NIR85912.1 ABC transporter ATP-binding protein [Gammaproteobacteria bacterium]NIR91904.1 ABC transporter ATP-binding protein [Gammaproteobacteria bacterium]NIU07161.1 ABC transporter ATP-binding protein [Gammaproteobacteria bacterium]NIV53974.1 ATP-binding cassette domain-containing protein [Gammaproteobacteria bacterium]
MASEIRYALEVRELTLRFGGLTAIDDVTFAVREGEIFAIVGPNGAGKTAALNCINGIYRPTSGTIEFGSRTIDRLPLHRVAQSGIGRAFQHVELFPHMTVLQNLLLGRHTRMCSSIFHGGIYLGRAKTEEIEHRRRAEEIIDFFELYRYRDRPAGSLPYGVQKLVGVARALATEPTLLLLDEPSTGLVREEKENLARFLLRIKHDLGVTMIWVEHDMQFVADLADRMLVLNYGVAIAEGVPDEVRKAPEVIKAYLGKQAQAVAAPGVPR